jgi:hypothetical protein
MRLLISFFLSVFVYVLIILFFLSFLFKKNTQKEVLIHTAIVVNTKEKALLNKTPKKKTIKPKKRETKPKKIEKIKKIKKIGSKTNVAKGGDVSFKDIFQNVKANVPTTPVKLQKSQMSRFKGLKRIEKNLNNVKLLSVDISYQSNSNSQKADIDEVIKKISDIWYQISDIPGEYAKINVINENGKVDVLILDSNLNQEKQVELVNLIKSLHFNKNFNVKILFQTKVNK